MDKLEMMYTKQKAFMGNLGIRLEANLNTHTGQDTVREIIFYLTQEIYEAAEWMKHKPWRQNPPPFNVKEFEMEIADIMHFFLELLIVCDIGPEKLFKLYSDKMEINKKRQENKY